jgi:tetratricopeptide (TPR) repeat protein
MMSRAQVILALMLAACAGCASTAQRPGPGGERVDIDSYTLLATFALERDDAAAAAGYYLQAALLSEDSDLAERATTLAYQADSNDVGRRAAERWRQLEPTDRRPPQLLALFAIRDGDLDEALEHLRSLVQDAPDQGAALGAIGELLAMETTAQTAASLMSRLVANFQPTAEGHYALARLALTAGDFDLALDSAQTAVGLDPDSVDGELLYARALLLAGRSDEALAIAARMAEQHSELDVRLQYAELLLSAGHSEEAEQRLKEILETSPGLPEAVRALAFLAMTRNDLDGAEQGFDELRGDPRYREEAFYYLGRIAETRKEYLQATRSYSRVVEGSHAVEAQIRTARIMFADMDDQEGALRHLREFGNANPHYRSQMLLAQGQILLQLDRADEAMKLLADAVEANPEDQELREAHVQLYVIVAQDAINRGDLDHGEELLAQGLHAYPGSPSIRYAQALLYQQQGRLRRSVSVLESLVKDRPDDPAMLNALGYLLTDQFRRHNEARGYIQKALALDPDNPAIIDSMGWVLFKLGNYQGALDYLERAFRLEQDPEIAAHLIDTRLALGERKEAMELLESSLAAHPESPHLQELSQRLAP